MQCPMKCVSGDHGAVRTHLAAIETQSVATNLPYTNLVGQKKRTQVVEALLIRSIDSCAFFNTSFWVRTTDLLYTETETVIMYDIQTWSVYLVSFV